MKIQYGSATKERYPSYEIRANFASIPFYFKQIQTEERFAASLWLHSKKQKMLTFGIKKRLYTKMFPSNSECVLQVLICGATEASFVVENIRPVNAWKKKTVEKWECNLWFETSGKWFKNIQCGERELKKERRHLWTFDDGLRVVARVSRFFRFPGFGKGIVTPSLNTPWLSSPNIFYCLSQTANRLTV